MGKTTGSKKLLTYSDYLLFPDDQLRHEIIEGEHYVTPSPVTRHQRISRRIHFQLYEQIEIPGLGEVYNAPTDLVLSEVNIVIPDLLVVLEENRNRITEKHIRGAPDLVVEITSPSTETRDREVKRTLFAKYGVGEYWIVLTGENAVAKFVLDGDTLADRGLWRERIAFDALPGVEVDLLRVW